MSYHEQSFKQRLRSMGDEAEHMFEAIAPLGKYVRYGWDRPPVTMANMAEELRHTPDYYTQVGTLVECAGLGKDGIYKLKLVKYDALAWWNKVQEVNLFLWNSSASEWVLLSWPQVKRLVSKARREGIEAFHDGNEYYPIQWDWVEGKLPYE